MSNLFSTYKKIFHEGLHFLNDNNFEIAEEKFELVIKQFPERVSVLTNLLKVKMKLKKFSDAEKLIKKLFEIDPNNKEANFNNAILLTEKGFFNQSLIQINNFFLLKDLDNIYLSEAHSIRGIIYSKLGLFKESIMEHKKAVELYSDNYLAKWNLGLSYLLNADFANGFKLYETRFLKNKSKFRNEVNSIKEIKNKNVLVIGEQGFGDVIQFARYLPVLKNHVKDLSFLPPLELFHFFKNLDVKVINSFQKEEYDFIIPIMSLPYIFQTNLNTIPSSNYLAPIKKKQLGSKKINIGLAWSGRDTYPYDFLRSIPLEKLNSIYNLDHNKFQFYCLQKDIRNSDKINFENTKILYHGDNNFFDLAKIILDLDLVVSSDTSILHLASTLQVKTFGLISYCPDWRWLLDTKVSPWYPSITLYRCRENNDWTTVSKEVAKDIQLLFY